MSLRDELARIDRLDDLVAPAKPVWTGPESQEANGGVTQSLLSRFLVCRERFRLYALEGLALPDTFSHRLEYGNFWHICEEYHAKEQDWQAPLLAYAQKLAQKYSMDQEKIDHWYRVCLAQFPAYVVYWSNHPDAKQRTPLLSEKVFSLPYQLPSGRTVFLRGKWDSVDMVERSGLRHKEKVIYLQENKSKGDINETQLLRQLKFDLQSLFYLTSLAIYRTKPCCFNCTEDGPPGPIWCRECGHAPSCCHCELPTWFCCPVAGIRYNVIRRPLAGGKHTIKQTKKETKDEFYQRLAGIIQNDPEWFFMRWTVDIASHDLELFRTTFLDPILEQLCQWYEWMAAPGNKPFACPLHWRTPYGSYSSILEGSVGSLDNYLDGGSRVGLCTVTNLFPELN